ncbi:MAG: hypothetical protein ABIN15_07360 [candidate division WOR-3 bacterium]
MDKCFQCEKGDTIKENTNCPFCGKPGKKVNLKTLKSLLKVSLRRIFPSESYFFCETENCTIVYYNSSGDVFKTEDVKVPVYQKESENPFVPVCYCFNHTLGEILFMVKEKREREIIDDINTGIKLNQCACDLRNPQGSCCLGNIYKIMKKSLKNS